MIPTSVKIGNRTIKVTIGQIDGDLMGYYDPQNLEIVINDALSKVQKIETFWHELIHAINDYNRFEVEVQDEIQSQLSDGELNPEDTARLEERITERFATTFLQVITDNNLLQVK